MIANLSAWSFFPNVQSIQIFFGITPTIDPGVAVPRIKSLYCRTFALIPLLGFRTFQKSRFSSPARLLSAFSGTQHCVSITLTQSPPFSVLTSGSVFSFSLTRSPPVYLRDNLYRRGCGDHVNTSILFGVSGSGLRPYSCLI